MKNFKEIRDNFFSQYGFKRRYKGKRAFNQNEYPTDIRVSFVDYVEHLRRDEIISERIAQSITLR